MQRHCLFWGSWQRKDIRCTEWSSSHIEVKEAGQAEIIREIHELPKSLWVAWMYQDLPPGKEDFGVKHAFGSIAQSVRDCKVRKRIREYHAIRVHPRQRYREIEGKGVLYFYVEISKNGWWI